MFLFPNIIFATFVSCCCMYSCRATDNRHTRGSQSQSSVISIELEGGMCGYGENYTYFVRIGDPRSVVFMFGGFGFCYDDDSCSITNSSFESLNANTVIDVDDVIESLENLESINNPPFYDMSNSYLRSGNANIWTIVFLPQCTEDFHLGNRSIYLGPKTGTFHFQGGNNVRLLIENILDEENDYVDFSRIDHFTVIGLSGGGYGAAFWSNYLFELVSDTTLKTLIIDGWWFDSSLFNNLVNSLFFVYNIANSPAITDELLTLYTTGGDVSLSGLIDANEDKFCDLFVSLLHYDFDSVLSGYHYILTNDISWLIYDSWTSVFNNDLLENYIGDPKRTSHYIAVGTRHQLFTDNDWTILSTKCNESGTLMEYMIDVIGDKSLVRKVQNGVDTRNRVRYFPKYSWNTISMECLQCDE